MECGNCAQTTFAILNEEHDLEAGQILRALTPFPGIALRSAIGLAHLWQKQGKRDEARQMLEQIYNWFTEGHDTADLREVRDLIVELSG